jgi:two-component system OmpR family sensor kinase
VGQLGLAFNTMLSDIEAAFAERDATEAKLRQFLADASHELRTPLTSIQGFAELSRLGAADARRGEAPALDSATAMRRIEEQAGRMRMLVEELLLLARLDRIREAARVPVDLTVLAADACSEAAALAPHRRISLQGPLPVVVLGDETHLRQAIANLVTNAIRHTPDDTPIEVSSMSSASVGTVEVRDHGEGLDSAGLVHAFDRFWRSDRSRASTGTGLGLSIVAAVAAEHGGRAEVANAPQGGAVFTLVIPAAPLSE